MATLAFNKVFEEKVNALFNEYETCGNMTQSYIDILSHAAYKGAMFDARCFSIPKEEVCNYFIWRQQDATRNSIQMVGQANFSHRELQNKSCNEIQDMLMTQKNINWNDFDTVKKRGSCCTKTGIHTVVNMQSGEQVERLVWEIDKEIPIFTQDRNYVERFV
jgi:tRNA(His) 5'-end guanylyltransferase